MPSKRNPDVYLQEILNAIDRIEGYVEGLTFESYGSLAEKQDAVERRLGVITEAADRYRSTQQHPPANIDWRAIHSLGNILRHNYDTIDPQTIWKIVRRDLPALRDAVGELLQNSPPGSSDA